MLEWPATYIIKLAGGSHHIARTGNRFMELTYGLTIKPPMKTSQGKTFEVKLLKVIGVGEAFLYHFAASMIMLSPLDKAT